MEQRSLAFMGYPEHFISEDGEVTYRGKYPTTWYDSTGSKKVRLAYNGTSKQVVIQNLVAQAFIPNPNNLPRVQHLDGNKSNNHHKNLQWVGTPKTLLTQEDYDSFKTLDFLGYPGYRISRRGVVVGPHGGVLIMQKSQTGYMRITLSNSGGTANWDIHRLVALCFIPPIEGKDFVNHKDLNKGNCHVDNLEWCTQQENMQHSVQGRIRDN